MHFEWQLGRAYFYPPWHDGLPTFRDSVALLLGLLLLAFGFKQYITIAEQFGYQVAASALASEAWKEIKEVWHA